MMDICDQKKEIDLLMRECVQLIARKEENI